MITYTVAETQWYKQDAADLKVSVVKKPLPVPTITTEYQYIGGTDSAHVSKDQTIDTSFAEWKYFDPGLMEIVGSSATHSEDCEYSIIGYAMSKILIFYVKSAI